ncbi:MAG: MATE family efflux transporter, partial [Anaerotignaceae bacterium]
VNVFGKYIVGAFNCSPETFEIALIYIKFVSVSFIANSVVFIFNGLATGSGNSLFALLNAFFSVILARIPLIFLFQTVLGFGLQGIFRAMGVCQYAGLITAICFYLSGKWKKSLVKKI